MSTPTPEDHPRRLVHLGLGAFARAHPLWYTWRAGRTGGGAADPETPWSYTGFTGRTAEVADTLTAQDCRYTVLQRGPEGDRAEVIDVLAAAHPGADTSALLAVFAEPALSVVTLTVTEAGYRRRSDGNLDRDDDAVAADITELTAADRADREPGPLRSIPLRLVAAIAARRDRGDHPLAVVSCDNLSQNGPTLARVVGQAAAELSGSGRYAGLADWLGRYVSFPATMVDRIVPATGPDDILRAAQVTGWADPATVVAEPFSEWVIAGDFPAGRPAWQRVGVELVDDVSPYEHRKLWLLNGGHCLLAYAGGARGHTTIAEAAADPVCRGELTALWDCVRPLLPFPDDEIEAYTGQLLQRFTNPGIRHRLEQIGRDGSQKLGVRVVPLVRRFLDAGQPVPEPLTGVLGAWVAHLRGAGQPVHDPRAAVLVPAAGGPLPEAARSVLGELDPVLADSGEVVRAVAEAATALVGHRG